MEEKEIRGLIADALKDDGGLGDSQLQSQCSSAITKGRHHEALLVSFLLYLRRRFKGDSKGELSALNIAYNKIENILKEQKYEMSPSGGGFKGVLYCSFCGKSQHEVKRLIAGPNVFICNECTILCLGIVNLPEAGKGKKDTTARKQGYEVEITKANDYKNPVAEIYFDGVLVAGVSQERSKGVFDLETPGEGLLKDKKARKNDIEKFMAAVEEACQKLKAANKET